ISYIFNNFQGNRAFHEVVEEAQRLGFTEPDPRDDLNGKDFLRKMLIIARDAGYTIEETQVELEPIIPESCLRAPNVETFYQALVEAAPHFEALKKNAEQE